MTLADDDVVGQAPCFGCLDCTHTGFKPKVRFRDLAPHIQDRLRAAEQMFKHGMWMKHGGPEHFDEASHRFGQALAAYEATFKDRSETRPQRERSQKGLVCRYCLAGVSCEGRHCNGLPPANVDERRPA